MFTRQDKTRPFKLNQSGIAHLLYPILGLAVVAVIAGAGFLVYQQNKSGAATKNSKKKDITFIIKEKNRNDKRLACNAQKIVTIFKPRGETLNGGRSGIKVAKGSISYAKKCSFLDDEVEYRIKVSVPSDLRGHYYTLTSPHYFDFANIQSAHGDGYDNDKDKGDRKIFEGKCGGGVTSKIFTKPRPSYGINIITIGNDANKCRVY